MNDRTAPAHPPSPQLASPPGRAERLLAQRIVILERPRLAAQMPALVDAHHSGLALCDGKAAHHTIELRSGYSGLLLEDSAPYEKQVATAEAPFDLPTDTLFGDELNTVLDDQRQRGADLAISPTRYIQAGDAEALKAVMKRAADLERDDVVIPLPVAVSWLMTDHLRQLTAVIKQIPHPVALILGGQFNPLRQFADAPQNLRAVLASLQEAGPVGLWRTDLAGFDALAHGAWFAGIGAGGSVRHLVPAGERAETAGPRGQNYPSVLVPDLMQHKRADTLEQIYANTSPPSCECGACQGGPLPSCMGRTDKIKAEAHTHNAATWTAWLPDFLHHQDLGRRQAWWSDKCRRALDAYDYENARVRQAKAFKPDTVLKKWAQPPVPSPRAAS